MGSKSDYLEKRLLNLVLGGVAYAPPATVYLALYTAAPDGETGLGGTEVVGGAYGRLGIANNQAEWPAAAGTPSLKVNANTHLFQIATTDWGQIVSWALFDAANGGNVLYYGDFAQPRTILAGDTATVVAGACKITED